jgi:hypothetical protein
VYYSLKLSSSKPVCLPEKYYSLDLDLYLEEMPDTILDIQGLFQPFLLDPIPETVAVIAFDNPFTGETYRLCLDVWGNEGAAYLDWAIYTEQFHEKCLPLKCFGPYMDEAFIYWRYKCLAP